MGWFWKKSLGVEARGGVPPWLVASGDENGGFARSYTAMLDEVFHRNPVGQRCVRLVASASGGLTVDASGEGGAAAARLVTRGDLVERIAAALLLHGNAYVQVLLDSRGAPVELALLRSERVSIATDARGYPSSYVVRSGSETRRISARDPLGRRLVVHLTALAPEDDHYGQGCLEAACAAATIYNRASRWNKALLDNGARPSGAMVYDPGDGSVLGQEQFDRLKQELAEQYAGSGNAGRPLLLDGGLKWQALSLSPADMDFIALKEGAARDIALAFGVPPVLVGLPGDATYSNAREAGRALYRQTVLPLAKRILSGLAEGLGEWLGEVGLEADVDMLSELAEDRALQWRQVAAADFLSRDEKRVQLGFGAEGKSQ